MSSRFWLPLGATLCLTAITVTSWAESRAEWGTPFTGSAPIDDQALMQVSARGIDEAVVKHLQGNGKLSDHATQAGASQSLFGTIAAESADKQATQTQYKMAVSAAQTVTSSIQLANVITAVTPAPTIVPLMGVPLFGMPSLPPNK